MRTIGSIKEKKMKNLFFLSFILFGYSIPNATAFDIGGLAGGLASQLGSQLIQKSLDQSFQQDLDEVFDGMASELLKGISTESKTAIKPFKTDNKQDKKFGEGFNNRLIKSLMDQTQNTIQIMERDQLEDVWQEVEEFGDSKIEKLVKDAGTETLIIGNLNKVSGGYEVSYKGVDLKGSTGKIRASTHVVKLELQ